MKTLYLTSNLSEIGGIQKYNKNFLRALSETDTEVSIVELKRRGIFSKIVFILTAVKKLLQFKPKIVVCAHINFSPLGYFFKKFFNKNYMILTYGIEAFGIKSLLKLRALKNSKMIITISNYTKEKLIQQISSIQPRIFIMANSVDGDEFKPQKKSDELLRRFNLFDKKIILTVARLKKSEKYKGYDKVIECLPQVIKVVPNIAYILIGSGDDADRARELTHKLNLNNYVIMPGFVSDKELTDYYNLCDVFVMPSKYEGFGFVFIEALACGKPVVAGNQDGSREALLAGGLGISVDPGNTNKIAEAIIKVLEKKIPPKLLDSQYLRERVLEAYGFDKFKEKVKNLLYELSR